MKQDAVIGCILGTAVGDALGLPYEGLSRRRAARIFPDIARHHLLFGHGLVSDDTEHTCFVAQALLASRGNAEEFAKRLSWSLRWWLAGLPTGVGLATLMAILKLWIGYPPDRSGVFSAGNGPAMRSSLIGVVYGHQPSTLEEFVRRSTLLTHSDPRAYHGALAVAVAAHNSAKRGDTTGEDFLKSIGEYLRGTDSAEFLDLLGRASASSQRGESASEFAHAIGCTRGISGYVYHTVPCVIQTWLRHQRDFRGAMLEMLATGGDTDTIAAILGGIIGAGVGRSGIPDHWLRGIVDWPRSVHWMEQFGNRLARFQAGDNTVTIQPLFVPGVIVRNMVFLTVILVHGLRRLAPPY